MPRKKLVSTDEPLITRPQRNMRAKKVFDPSDNHIPKRRNKSVKSVKKKRNQDVKAKNQITSDSSSNDAVTPPFIPSPQNCIVRPENDLHKPNCCSICLKAVPEKRLVYCKVCEIKAHLQCLIIDEPMWKFDFDLLPWVCIKCRTNHCCKCYKLDYMSLLTHRCITCNLGLHVNCYESFDPNPFHTVQAGVYLCIPCMTLATIRMPEEEEEEDDEKPVDTRNTSISLLTSDEDDDNNDDKDDDKDDDNDEDIDDGNDDEKYSKNNLPIIPNGPEKQFTETPEYIDEEIPNVTEWDKFQVHNYLLQRLPQAVAESLLVNEFDGRAILLFRRSNIRSLKMKLGCALKVYKEIRILQTQKSYYSVYWE